jgi:hypothetical protein
MRLLILPFLLISFASIAQCKTYKLSAKGDTINCVDRNDLRQGKWVVRFDNLRGEPGFDEEGIYKDGKKEGVWRKYNLMGDLLAIERYRWGNKDGLNQYYTMQGVDREESWKAVNPANPYDTIDVPDPVNPDKIQRRVIKIEGTSVKHGRWRYYNSESGLITKTENWFLDKLQDPFGNPATAATQQSTDAKPAIKVKPKEVEAFEKKIGKKKIKVIDGRTYQ